MQQFITIFDKFVPCGTFDEAWSPVEVHDLTNNMALTVQSPLNLRRNGMAFTVYKGRIYAIGGKSYCYADPLLADDPSYLCQVAGWQLSGDNAASDRSTTMESIDPRTGETLNPRP